MRLTLAKNRNERLEITTHIQTTLTFADRVADDCMTVGFLFELFRVYHLLQHKTY